MNTIWRALLSCGNCWEVNNVTEKTNVPEIRFAGFTDPWEQRKFSDLTDRVSIQSSDSDLPQVEYEDIVSGEGTLNKDLHDKEGGKTGIKFYAGDVLYGKLRPYLMNWLYPQFNGIAVGDFWVLRATECDSSFLYRLVQTDSFQRLANVSTGSKMPRADWNLISQSFFAVPADYAEQKAIAKSLAELDSLITLHQRKHDKLVQLKKSMLDKMFPKPGETEPEIRFAGFTDPWEQRKLGEFSKKITTKNADGGLSETFTNSAEQGVISQLDYFDHDITNNANISGYYVVQPDNFVYNPRISVTAPCGPINRNRLNRAGVMSPLYTVFSVDESVDKTYLEHYFKTSRWHDFMFLEGNSGARSDRFSISDATFFEMPIWCPKIPEQRAIAKQLETTDSLITLHQREPRFADTG